MGLHTYKSNTGNGIIYNIKRYVHNSKLWVLLIYMDNKTYPNIITGRYKSLKKARDVMSFYQINNKISDWGIY